MKTSHSMKKNLLVTSVTTLCLALAGNAQAWEESEGYNHGYDLDKYIYQGTKKHITDNHEIYSKVTINKDIHFRKNLVVDGSVVRHDLDTAAVALVHDEQEGVHNAVDNWTVDNHTTVYGNVGAGAKGNITVNTASGDNNIQANAVSIASTDAGKLWGIADSETFLDQDSYYNVTRSMDSTNTTSVEGAFKDASGNLALNAAAGAGNLQKNDLAISETYAALSESTARMRQDSWDNYTLNETVDNTASIGGDTLAGALGNAGVNVASGTGNIQANALNIAVGTGIAHKPPHNSGH